MPISKNKKSTIQSEPVASTTKNLSKKYILKPGENIFLVLTKLGIPAYDSSLIISKARKHIKFRQIKPGFELEYIKKILKVILSL